MKPLFVAGIGTGVGKTMAAAILVEKLQSDYWKPIQAGDLDNSDTDTVKRLISNKKSGFHKETYRFQTPASPHYAAAIENEEISLDHFILPDTKNHLVIEGAGGLMVPLNEKGAFIADLIKLFDAEVILVIQTYLGAINHTLLSLELLKQKDIFVRGIVINGTEMPSTENFIRNFSKLPVVGRIFPEVAFEKHTVKKYASGFNL